MNVVGVWNIQPRQLLRDKKMTNKTKQKNPIRCWDCRMKDKDCYCKLESKNSLKEVNKIIEKEGKSK